MAFGLSDYASIHNKLIKPFNPLLGETFEYENEQKGYKLLAE